MTFITRGLIAQILFLNFAGAQQSFNSLDSILDFADGHSISSKVLEQQALLAKWTKVAALANTINFKSPVSFSSTDNLLLPVNFIPADAFGAPGGTLRQITLGQEYVSNFNFNPQIDIINPQNWARVKSAELNKEITGVNGLLNKKALKESIAAAYFNCVALNAQIINSEKSLSVSDSLALIVKNKLDLGIAREQDYNNAKVNTLLVSDKLNQLRINRSQQINVIKVLCDIPANKELLIEKKGDDNFAIDKAVSTLESKLQVLQRQYMKNELNVGRLAMLPVVSFIYYQGLQQNSNAKFFDNKAEWIQSKYLGLRLTMPFPPDVTRLSQNYTNKVNYRMAELNAEHSILQNEMSNGNLDLELEKANTSVEVNKQVVGLKNANYRKSLNQYNEGILSTENLLTAFMDLLNAKNNLIFATSALDYTMAKIRINNSLK